MIAGYLEQVGWVRKIPRLRPDEAVPENFAPEVESQGVRDIACSPAPAGPGYEPC